MSNTEISITKEQFNDFRDLQVTGAYNMIDPAVREIVGLTKEEHYYILKNYEVLIEKYRD